MTLFARDAFVVAGNVTLKAGQSIRLYQGALADIVPGGQLTIAAPYVLLSGHTDVKADFGVTYASVPRWAPPTTVTQGVLNVAANLIDFQNDDTLFGFQDGNFTSQGDIRFLAPTAVGSLSPATATRLLTPGNLSFKAAQLYPVSGAAAVVAAGVDRFDQVPNVGAGRQHHHDQPDQ